MLNHLKILCLVDNCTTGKLLGEHGLSFLIEADGTRILFDTGAGMAFEHNRKIHEVAENSVDFLVFSHGHNDHTGGLKDAMKLLKKNAKIIFHPAALEPKYSRHPDKIHYIGISDENKTLLLNSQYEKLISAKPVKIMDGAWTSGELKQKYPEELAEKKFSLDPDGKIDDNIADDMSLFFETKNGIVIIAGCCHAGLANTIDQSISVFEGKNLHAFIGGTHLGNVTKKRLDFTADFLQKHSIQVFAPSHCTGEMSKNYLYSKNPQIYTPCFAGAEFIF